MRGKLSCERCGSIDVRRHPKRHWNDHDRWMCRSCIIIFELVEHARDRMRIEQRHARHPRSRNHSSENIRDNLASARSRASKHGLPATLMTGDWECVTAFFKHVCAYCGDKWEEVEHATPVCREGGTTLANCLPSCSKCNAKKHQRTLEELLVNDSWPHRTERLKRALSWLQLHGRTATNPSGCTSPLSLEIQKLLKMRERERLGLKPWFGKNVWFGLSADIVASLERKELISASVFDRRGLVTPYVMKGPCWEIHLTETGRSVDILQLAPHTQPATTVATCRTP